MVVAALAWKRAATPSQRPASGPGRAGTLPDPLGAEFFGEKARMMGGPAALPVQTGAALMPAILWFEGDGWGVQIPACRTKLPAAGSKRAARAAARGACTSNYGSGH